MKIIQEDDSRFMVVGSVKVPIRAVLIGINEDTKKLTGGQHELIIRDAGVDVPPGMEAKDLLYLAMSFVQNAWYQATSADGSVPQTIIDKHAARLEDFERAAERVRAKPVPAVKPEQESKPVKSGRAPKQHKLITFAIGPASAEGLKGQIKQVYDAAVTVNTRNLNLGVAEKQLVEEALAQGFTTKDTNVPYKIRWLALQLVKTDHLYIGGTQSEIPGTLSPLPEG